MYPVSLGVNEARSRIEGLLKNGHHAEALLTSVFTVEKTLKRTLKYIMIRRGFTSGHADKLLDRYKGLAALRDVWSCFDTESKGLPELVGDEHWRRLPEAQTMRNKLVHGERVYKLADCRVLAEYVLASLGRITSVFRQRYGYDGWTKLPTRKKSALSWLSRDPKRSA